MAVSENVQVSIETADQLGLSEEEFERIKKILGRTPNFTELSIYAVMWSEHCSYNNSIKYLKTLPREGGRLLLHVSNGGYVTTLMESAFAAGMGFAIDTVASLRKEAFLFGEGQGRAIVTAAKAQQSELERVLHDKHVPFVRLGTVNDGEILIDDEAFGNVHEWAELYVNVLDTHLEN